jgi:hypothetical protein
MCVTAEIAVFDAWAPTSGMLLDCGLAWMKVSNTSFSREIY